MARVTLRVLDGADRGRTFENLTPPITVGREDGNSVQLNDERVSRFHLKIQEDAGRLVLTDLQSTNGTKINGESVQIWVLRPGDVIQVGRSMLLFGSRDEIARRLASLRNTELSSGIALDLEDAGPGTSSILLDDELRSFGDPETHARLHTLLPPELPDDLSPAQAAQLAELLLYLQLRLRQVISAARAQPKSDKMTIEAHPWQSILDLQDRLARYLRTIGEPNNDF